jgi:hypothetical protein
MYNVMCMHAWAGRSLICMHIYMHMRMRMLCKIDFNSAFTAAVRVYVYVRIRTDLELAVLLMKSSFEDKNRYCRVFVHPILFKQIDNAAWVDIERST